MAAAGFEPAFPASEWPQTHALNSAAIRLGIETLTDENTVGAVWQLTLNDVRPSLKRVVCERAVIQIVKKAGCFLTTWASVTFSRRTLPLSL